MVLIGNRGPSILQFETREHAISLEIEEDNASVYQMEKQRNINQMSRIRAPHDVLRRCSTPTFRGSEASPRPTRSARLLEMAPPQANQMPARY
jgi:hypothetical protein